MTQSSGTMDVVTTIPTITRVPTNANAINLEGVSLMSLQFTRALPRTPIKS